MCVWGLTPAKTTTRPMRPWILTIALSVLGTCVACAGGKRALLVGISEYPTHRDAGMSWNPIHGANDVELVKDTLLRQGFDVTTLTGPGATAAAIRRALGRLARECRSGELVYIHFSGHGQAFEDLSGDEEDGWDEAIVPYDAMLRYSRGTYEGGCHIIDDELEEYFSAVRSKVGEKGYVYVVLDACHMGGASRGDEGEDYETFVRGTDRGFSPGGKRYVPKIDRRGNMRVEPRRGMGGICILEACRAYQTNAEIREGGRYYGPLSYYVDRTLRKVSLSADPVWTETVRSMMGKDKRLVRQNMVIEKTD